ncbi:tyrosine-type recombinase/integrase [Micromonospora sp. WMMD710]|uniref:tyrosine-type recombinase/integrase n=1 Tax=Micromonospora sp. WMMD710 TaxID=3016085 RepID=UPI002417B124|nr:tyrosine-type recombinase/integrase [Micromonospora sp. WMMD710]MDG4756407.1 tyrosine-type recombinase/integrase [Micromonospora sp. WMMD710]
MAASNGRNKRQRGEIETLPSGSLRVKVYAGVDPISGKRHYLTEVIPAGRTAAKDAEKARTRLLAQVDERRNPRTRATLDQLLDRWLEVADIEATTRMGYVSKLNKHVRPVLGKLPVGRLDAETLESFYASLRRCRDWCGGKAYVKHRVAGEHTCTAKCRPHVCKPLSASSVRQIHWILSGALSRAVRWHWIAVNPAGQAEPPAPPHPDPQPPNPADAARIINEAWRDPDWGALVWLAMTTGARRGELCALRWQHLDLPAGVLTLRRSAYLDEHGKLREKDTKTHQQRRVALDPETIEVLRELHGRYLDRLAQLDADADTADYVFSPEPDNSRGYRPDTITQRYGRLATRLGINSHIHALRHYSATELINAGVDVRTVAGRLGHGGGGTTTLRVYAAWLSESDQRAAGTLAARMPPRPIAPTQRTVESSPYQRVAGQLREQITAGRLRPGEQLPAVADLATAHGVSGGTAHRAVALLAAEGLVSVVRGRRATVAYPRDKNPPDGPRGYLV